MKLSRTSRIILGLGILVITLGSLGVARSQQLNEGKRLSDDLAIAELRLSKLDLKELYSQQEKLQAQVSQAAAQRDTAKAALSLPNDSITITEAVFRVADTSGVDVSQISSSALSNEKLDGVACSMLPVTVVVRGDLPNLIDFIMRLNTDFSIGIVKSAEIVMPKATDNSTEEAIEEVIVVVTDNTTGDATDNLTAPPADTPAGSALLDLRPSAQVQLVIYTYKG